MKYILGLTGQTGAGKSTLHSVAQKKGFYVIDCDKVAHLVLSENEKLKTELVKAFGDVLTDNKIDRRKLAAKAFSNAENTELLNKITLPFIINEINYIIENTANEYILLDAPTLYESGADSICNFVVALLANEEIRKKRIIERDNLSTEAAELRLSAAKTDDFYIGRADKIIYNNGSKEEYLGEFRNLLNSLTEE